MELKPLRRELSSEASIRLYRELRRGHPLLTPFRTPLGLISFFHRTPQEYATKDAILRLLIEEYQKGAPTGPYHQMLSILFLVLFTPALVRLCSRARKAALSLDPEEALDQICLFLLETLQGTETAQAEERIAGRIMGRVKNLTRNWLQRRFQEERAVEEYLDEKTYEPAPGIPAPSDEGISLEEASGFLDLFVRAGVITETEKLLILHSRIGKRPLKAMAASPQEYQRIKKRRQRAIRRMDQYLQERRRLYAEREGLEVEEVSMEEVFRRLINEL